MSVVSSEVKESTRDWMSPFEFEFLAMTGMSARKKGPEKGLSGKRASVARLGHVAPDNSRPLLATTSHFPKVLYAQSCGERPCLPTF